MEERITKRIAELEQQRDAKARELVAQLNLHLAPYNVAIDELKALLEPRVPEASVIAGNGGGSEAMPHARQQNRQAE